MNPKSKNNPFRSDLLADKTALVTGAGKGIGRQCAISLAECGARVIAVARTKADLDSLHKEAGDLIVPVVADALSSEFLDYLGTQAHIDILVNNLGINVPQPFVDVELDTFDRMLDVNVRSVYKITQVVVKNMLANKLQGSIINMSSQMGHIGSPGRTIYCLTKHAIEGLTKALGVELAPKGIRVNSVAPTFIETPMTKPMLDNKEFHDFVMGMIPLEKIGQPVDVANAVVYLASDASDMVTGTSLKVDGGWTAR